MKFGNPREGGTYNVCSCSFVLEMNIENAAIVISINLRGIKPSCRHPARIQAHTNPGIKVLNHVFDDQGIAIQGSNAMVMNRHFDIILLCQPFQTFKDSKIVRFDNDQSDSHYLCEFK